MTNKEFYQAIVSLNISAELTEKATKLLATAENDSKKRTAEQSANRTANVTLANQISALMADNRAYAASEIVELMKSDGVTISTSKVTAVAKVAIEDGLWELVADYKVGGKGRKVNGYRKAETPPSDSADTDGEDDTDETDGED